MSLYILQTMWSECASIVRVCVMMSVALEGSGERADHGLDRRHVHNQADTARRFE